MGLTGTIFSISQIGEPLRTEMFALMDLFYCRMERSVFERDLEQKDYAVLLFDEERILRGFTTQKLLWVDTPQSRVRGMFSGDTIIHRQYWGSIALFQTFSQFYFQIAKDYPDFYWFLICKGYKTYRLLPLFFRSFYPREGTPTPLREKAIIDAYGSLLYPREYDAASGIIRYSVKKDALRAGVADITEKERRNPHIRFFEQVNPGYLQGDDLACLARFSTENLRPGAEKLLMGGNENEFGLSAGK